MAMNETIATLTGSLVFKADYTTLTGFEQKLAAVEAKLISFGALANQKFNVSVKLDQAGLKAQLESAAETKLKFTNASIAKTAMDAMEESLKTRLDNTRINLKNVKINVSEVLAQRALLRDQLEKTNIAANVLLKFKEANAQLYDWKANVESKFKLRLNAGINKSKFYQNVQQTLTEVGLRLGNFVVKSPKIKLSVDRQHLKQEIADVLSQIQREARIKIDLNSKSVNTGGSRRHGSGVGGLADDMAFGGMFGRGAGLFSGLIPGIGGMFALDQLNKINQQQQGQQHAMMAVTGSAENAAATKARLDAMGNEIGFNSREMAPSFIKMIASGQGSGFSQDQSEKIFKSMTEYGRVMGLDKEEMKGSLKAVEQMMNKGQIMSEELKGQLGERFPAAVALMAESQGKTIPELLKTMKAGQLSSQALIKFAELISQKARVGGALGLAENATAAQQARLENSFSTSVASFSAGGFDKATSDFFKNVAEAIEKAQPLINALGATFNDLMQPVEAVIKLLGDLVDTWPDMAKGLGMTTTGFTMLAAAMALAFIPGAAIAVGLGVVALALEDIVAYTQGKKSIFGEILEGLTPERLANLFTLSQNLRDTSDALFDLQYNFKELFGLMSDQTGTSTLSKAFDSVVERMQSMLNIVKNLALTLSSLMKGDFSAAGTALNGIATNVIHEVGVPSAMRWLNPNPESYMNRVAAGFDQDYQQQNTDTQGRYLMRHDRDEAWNNATKIAGDKNAQPGSVMMTGPITMTFTGLPDAALIEEHTRRVIAESNRRHATDQKVVE